jgi:hypothetical protein
VGIVREGLLYRQGKGKPVTPAEIEQINGLILEIGFRFPDLWDEGFRAGLAVDDASRAKERVAQARRNDETLQTARQHDLKVLDQLRDDFIALYALTDRQAAGLRLEGLLNRLFQLAGLAPREPFRVVGEQIDGSFELDHEIYLVEAKWVYESLSEAPLLVFRGKAHRGSGWLVG